MWATGLACAPQTFPCQPAKRLCALTLMDDWAEPRHLQVLPQLGMPDSADLWGCTTFTSCPAKCVPLAGHPAPNTTGLRFAPPELLPCPPAPQGCKLCKPFPASPTLRHLHASPASSPNTLGLCTPIPVLPSPPPHQGGRSATPQPLTPAALSIIQAPLTGSPCLPARQGWAWTSPETR